jgi:hypothetical protein
MYQKVATLFIFTMATLILTSHFSLPQEKSDDSDIPALLLKKISIHLNNVPFETILDTIARKGDVQLNYNRNRIPVEQLVSINMENKKVVDILQYVLDITNTELRVSSSNQVLIVPANIDKNLKGRIYGVVISSTNKRPLIGANVLLDGFLLGAATDTNGKFTMDNLPVGNYTVRISYIGYQTIFIPDIIVKSERIRFLNAELEEASIPGEKVIIEDNYFSNVSAQPVSSTNFSAEEIRRSATLAGDVTRIINSLPSISNENEGNHIVARGGSTIENSFYVDNIQMPNINHFPIPGTSGGLASLLNIDFIKDVNVYSGGFSALYGDRLSSVLNIKYREGNREEIDAQLDLNIIGISGQVEGPFGTGEGSWMVSARHSFNDIVLQLSEEDEQPTVFTDIQLKLIYNLSKDHQLSLMNLYSDDDWLTPKPYSISNYWNWYGNFLLKQNVFGINWKYLWNKNGYSITTISHVFHKQNLKLNKTAGDSDLLRLDTRDNLIQFRNVNYYSFNSKHKLEFGTEAKIISSNIDNFFARGYDVFGNYKPDMRIDKLINTYKIGGFISYEWMPVLGLRFIPGLRVDYFEYNENLNISPRFSVSYLINKKTSFTGSAGLFYQSLPLYFLSQNEGFRKLSDPLSYNLILGFNYLFSEDTKFTIELYNKEHRRIPVDPDLYSLYLLDEAIYGLFYTNHFNLVNNGEGNTRGLELMVQKKLSHNFYGMISTSFFRSTYKDLNGAWRDRIIDNKFLFAIESGYKIDEEWEFSMRFNYAGGMAYTPYDIQRSVELQSGVFDVDQVNSLRLPDYHILSIRVDRRFHFSGSNMIIYLSIWNVFDQENISIHGWSEMYNLAVNYKLMDRVPVFGIEFEF